MTHRIVVLLGLLLLGALALPAGSSAAPGADRYIVVLERGASDSDVVARDHGRRYGASVRFTYGHALKGYAATIADDRIDDVRRDPRVAYVERDATARTVAQALPWGVDRVDADISSTRAGDGTGAISNVNAYVIDTGIDKSHPDLSVVGHVNYAGGPNKDCNGHGTHVAGTVAAKDNASDVVGVAPGAPLTGVKVLSCSGSGYYSRVIKGVDYVTANARKPAVANMSLGGPPSQALDDAIRRSANSGVFYALAAGNDGKNACDYSPARAGLASTDTNGDGAVDRGDQNGIATTAATDQADKETSWSNYGRCVDVWSPGASILSTRAGGGTTTMSGTSMASPHTAAAGALILSSRTADGPTTIEGALKEAATKSVGTSKDLTVFDRLYVGGF